VLCASYLFVLVIHYLFICAHYSLFIYLCSLFVIIVHLFCSLFDFSNHVVVRFHSSLTLLFHCSSCIVQREKFNSDPGLCSGILILHTTSSIRVNKHRTADSTNFVFVWREGPITTIDIAG
jgi:hypothetical protein